MRARATIRLMAVYLSFILLGMLVNMSFPIMHATGQYQTHATPPMSTVNTFREPFKDFFDYEWWLPGSSYAGMGKQYGKWFVIEMFYPNGKPNHNFHISNVNPISGTDSARMDINGSRQTPLCETWIGLTASPDPDHLIWPDKFMNPGYMRFRFRIDRWDATNSYWRVTLGQLSGNEQSCLIVQTIIALEGFAPPHLWMLYKTGSNSSEWVSHELVSSTTVSLEEVHTIELYRYAHPTNGETKVWLDGSEVSDLTVQNLDTSYPGGVSCVRIGSNEHYTKLSPGSWATITYDDLRVRDQYIGEDPIPITYYDLTLDSSPQGKTVRVGNWIVGQTPVTIKVPEGTMPKVGVNPTGFDHWELEGDYTEEQKELFANYSEPWYNVTTPLITNVIRAPSPPGQNVGPEPTPAIYSDTRITAMYTTGIKHTLNVASNPAATSFTVDELDYVTPWNDSLTEGTHTISMPSTFTVGEKRYDFRGWEDSSTNPTRTVNLMSDMNVTAYYDVTIIPEFPTLIAWLVVVGVATLVVVLGAKRLRVY